MESITCPFCQEPGFLAMSDEGWDARQCPSCRLVFLSPRPSAEDVRSLYEQDHAHASAAMHLGHFGASASRLANRRTVALLKRHRPTGRLLEIGPGGGELLREARDAGYDVAAVELNPVQADFIREQVGVQCWNSIDEVEGQFDLVYHCDVLSHFFDPVAAFAQIRGLLTSDGLHVFETGEGDFSARYRRLFATLQFPDHLFFFSERSLSLLLARSGFRRIETQRFSLVPQLQFERLLDRARAARSSEPADIGAGQAEHAGLAAPAESGLKGAAVARLRHVLRYGLGRALPSTGRPQTVVVVAQVDNSS